MYSAYICVYMHIYYVEYTTNAMCVSPKNAMECTDHNIWVQTTKMKIFVQISLTKTITISELKSLIRILNYYYFSFSASAALSLSSIPWNGPVGKNLSFSPPPPTPQVMENPGLKMVLCIESPAAFLFSKVQLLAFWNGNFCSGCSTWIFIIGLENWKRRLLSSSFFW